jgi:methyltransferase (TIGR00027 family)
LCRKRYIDEKLLDVGSRMEAIVNLGAGFDTRTYRLAAISHLPVWEVDQQENIQVKEKRLNETFGKVPSNVKLVAIDFDHENVGAVLASHGYTATKRTCFVWEAVTQYLTEDGVRKTFDFLANAPIDSCLAFTYVRKDFLDGKTLYGWGSGYKRFVATKVWMFGMEPESVPNFLAEYGWGLIEDVGYEELAARYIIPQHRNLVSTPVERMVYANKLEVLT